MTELRADGNLATDSPVVAACFIRKPVLGISGKPNGQDGYDLVQFTLCVVTVHGGIDRVYGKPETAYLYPILIPAQTVAEVCFDKDDLSFTREFSVIEMYVTDGTCSNLLQWLREHVKEAAK